MRKDQYEKLQAMSEKLTDVILEEADCDKWPGATIPIDKQDKAVRGDRYWYKKNAVATVALVIRIGTLVDIVRANSSAGDGHAAAKETEDELDREISDAEQEAAKLMKTLTSTEARKKFAEKVNGKT